MKLQLSEIYSRTCSALFLSKADFIVCIYNEKSFEVGTGKNCTKLIMTQRALTEVQLRAQNHMVPFMCTISSKASGSENLEKFKDKLS